MYCQKVIEHVTSPQNVGRMLDADGIGIIGEPDCGDNCMVFIKVRNEIIHDNWIKQGQNTNSSI